MTLDDLAEILSTLRRCKRGLASLRGTLAVGAIFEGSTGTPLNETARWHSAVDVAVDTLSEPIQALAGLIPRGTMMTHENEQLETTVELDLERLIVESPPTDAIGHFACTVEYWIRNMRSYLQSADVLKEVADEFSSIIDEYEATNRRLQALSASAGASKGGSDV